MSAQIDTVEAGLRAVQRAVRATQQSRRAHPALARAAGALRPRRRVRRSPPASRTAAGAAVAGRDAAWSKAGTTGSRRGRSSARSSREIVERGKRVLALTRRPLPRPGRHRDRDEAAVRSTRSRDATIVRIQTFFDQDVRPARVRRPVAFPAHAEPQSLLRAPGDRRARAGPGDPLPAVADDPFLRRLEREDGGEGAGHGQAGRHPARQPRGRDPGRPQGGGPRGPDPRRQGGRLRRHPALDPREQPREPLGAGRPDAARHRDRRQARA